MIPKSVTREQVLAALRQIDRDGVPRGRASRGFDLVHEGDRYPPKYAIALAVEAATGRLPDSAEFGGGEETNTFLRVLGFTIVGKDEGVVPQRAPSSKPAPSTSGTTIRVGRIFLNLGVRMSDFRTSNLEPHAFHRLTQAQFNQGPTAYRDRILGLIRRAHEAGAEVVALPACALIAGDKVTTESYAVPSVPLVIAGEAQAGEFAVVMKEGVVIERFDSKRVHWLDAGRFTVLTAISSTIGKVILDHRYEEPVRSQRSPPDLSKATLVVDVGHQQYRSRYLAQTLRCVARDVAAKTGQPAAVVLSSWMWASKGIKGPWCQPLDRVAWDRGRNRLSGPDERDVLDIVDIDLTPKGTGRGR